MADQTVIVTGAAKGIGFGISEKFCEAGYDTIMLGRSANILESAEKLREKGFEAEGMICDVSDKNAVDRAVERIFSGRESVQVLVNNAGVSELYMFEDTTDDILDAHINVNLKGTWYMTQAVIGRMRAHRYGRIINMASVTGPMVCDRGFSAYGMTKAGIVGLTKAIAVEYAQYSITCNAICPGYILTPGVEHDAEITNPLDPELPLKKLAEGVPLGRLGTIHEVGALAVFLAGKDAGYITGTTQIIDGGNLLPETNAIGL